MIIMVLIEFVIHTVLRKSQIGSMISHQVDRWIMLVSSQLMKDMRFESSYNGRYCRRTVVSGRYFIPSLERTVGPLNGHCCCEQ